MEEEVEAAKEQNQQIQDQLVKETSSLANANTQIQKFTTEISTKVNSFTFIYNVILCYHWCRMTESSLG